MKQSKTFSSGFSVEETIETLRQQLAASQAREVQLREALKTAGMNCVDDFIAAGALQLADSKSDTSALEAMIAEAGEVMRERCADGCDRLTMYGPVAEAQQRYNQAYRHCKDRILTSPGVTLEDLK